MNKKKLCRVMASVNPTPHTNAERMWLSSGRVPLHNILTKKDYLNFSERSFGSWMNQRIDKLKI